MRLSRNRIENSNQNVVVKDDYSKKSQGQYQHYQQDLEYQKQQMLKKLEEKEQELQSKQNNNQQKSTQDELLEYLIQKKNLLEAKTHQMEIADPTLLYKYNQEKQKNIQNDDFATVQAYQSKEEIERLKRFQLREEERQRRLLGDPYSAYDKRDSYSNSNSNSNNNPWSMYTKINSQALNSPQQLNYQNRNQNLFQQREIEESIPIYKNDKYQRDIIDDNIQLNSNKNSHNTPPLPNNNNKNQKLEKQKMYRQQLDEQMKQKQLSDFKPTQNNDELFQQKQNLIPNLPGGSYKKGNDVEKKKYYGEELRKQMLEKQGKNLTVSSNNNSGSINSNKNKNEYISPSYDNFIGSPQYPNQIQYELQGSNNNNKQITRMNSGLQIGMQDNNNKDKDIDKKQKYKEELQKQIDEQKQKKQKVQRPQSHFVGNKQQEQSEEYYYIDDKYQDQNFQKSPASGFSQAKFQQEEDAVAIKKEQEKLKLAEELRKQIEDKTQQKKIEVQRIKQEEKRQRELLEQIAYEEKHPDKIIQQGGRKRFYQNNNQTSNTLNKNNEQEKDIQIIEQYQQQYQQQQAITSSSNDLYGDYNNNSSQNQIKNIQNKINEDFQRRSSYQQKQQEQQQQQYLQQQQNFQMQLPQNYIQQNRNYLIQNSNNIIQEQNIQYAQPLDQQQQYINQQQYIPNEQLLFINQISQEKNYLQNKALEEEIMLEQYRNKVKDLILQKLYFQKEYEKLQAGGLGSLPIPNQKIPNDLLSEIKASLVRQQQYSQIQNNFMNMDNKSLPSVNQLIIPQHAAPQQECEVSILKTNRNHDYQSHSNLLQKLNGMNTIDEINQSLPSISKQILQENALDLLQQTYYKDLNAFQQISLTTPKNKVNLPINEKIQIFLKDDEKQLPILTTSKFKEDKIGIRSSFNQNQSKSLVSKTEIIPLKISRNFQVEEQQELIIDNKSQISFSSIDSLENIPIQQFDSFNKKNSHYKQKEFQQQKENISEKSNYNNNNNEKSKFELDATIQSINSQNSSQNKQGVDVEKELDENSNQQEEFEYDEEHENSDNNEVEIVKAQINKSSGKDLMMTQSQHRAAMAYAQLESQIREISKLENFGVKSGTQDLGQFKFMNTIQSQMGDFSENQLQELESVQEDNFENIQEPQEIEMSVSMDEEDKSLILGSDEFRGGNNMNSYENQSKNFAEEFDVITKQLLQNQNKKQFIMTDGFFQQQQQYENNNIFRTKTPHVFGGTQNQRNSTQSNSTQYKKHPGPKIIDPFAKANHKGNSQQQSYKLSESNDSQKYKIQTSHQKRQQVRERLDNLISEIGANAEEDSQYEQSNDQILRNYEKKEYLSKVDMSRQNLDISYTESINDDII